MGVYDSSTQSSQNDASPLTFSHTTSLSNRVIFVGVQVAGTPATGVTYGGVSLSKLTENTVTGDHFSLWGVVDPLLGANNVSIAYGGSTIVRAIAASYGNCKQTGLPDAVAQNSSTTGTSLSQAITVVDATSWVVAFGFAIDNNITASTGLTSRFEESGADRYLWADSDGATGAGAYNTTITFNSSTENSLLLASFAEPVPTTNHLKFYRRTRFPGNITGA